MPWSMPSDRSICLIVNHRSFRPQRLSTVVTPIKPDYFNIRNLIAPDPKRGSKPSQLYPTTSKPILTVHALNFAAQNEFRGLWGHFERYLNSETEFGVKLVILGGVIRLTFLSDAKPKKAIF